MEGIVAMIMKWLNAIKIDYMNLIKKHSYWEVSPLAYLIPVHLKQA